MSKFGFIGCGNMGGALARAVAKAVDEPVLLSDHHHDKMAALCADTGARISNTQTIAAECGFIFLGVKPQVTDKLLDEIRSTLAARGDGFVLVSMAAGISIAQLCEMAGGEYPTIIIKPNTPVAVGEGMTQYTKNALVTDAQHAEFLDAMRLSGVVAEQDEKFSHAAGAVSGCGPAFAYLFIEALADAGVKCGLPRAKAMQYAAQTLVGAGKMVLETGEHPGALKDAVCSPAGATIEGIHALERNGFRGAVIDAVVEAFKRTTTLGQK